MEHTGCIVGINWLLILKDHLPGVNFFLDEERRNASLRLPVDNGPVDGRCPAILRQQRPMQVERTNSRRGPNHFGQHSKSNDDLQITAVIGQLRQKRRIAKFFGLQHRDVGGLGGFFYRRRRQRQPTPRRSVGGRHNRHDLATSAQKTLQAGNGEIGRSHKHDAKWM